MCSASATPPSNIIGTLGESHIRSTSATTPAKRSTFLVRLEIWIGVGLVCVCGELMRLADPLSCLTVLYPMAERRSRMLGASLLRLFVPILASFGTLVIDLFVNFRAKKQYGRRDIEVNQQHDDRAEAAVEGAVAR